MAETDYERLGSFYLGKGYDPGSRQRLSDLLLYDSKDLVTHAVCVGMTGSGKTGLCVGLLEEAAIDGIPAIVIDPKGDLANLALTFPDLQAADFLPWIDPAEAQAKGVSPEEQAARHAERWRAGLAEWDQSPARITRLREAAEVRVYTPGSSAGLPVSVMRSFEAPPPAILEDGELFRERVASTTTGLLAMAGVEADPLKSREHILVSAVIASAWSSGRSLDLPALIHDVQQPPFAKLGVMEVESVFPAQERFGLAMALNNLAASPNFSAWTQGEPLDVQSILWSPAGKPRLAVFSIAHLGDAERMFFVSMLLNQVLGWVRQQSGTSSLRAILYMDEIAGYVPPVANPPSKRPLLTLMKQGRAFGMGVMLATQNPVDLDYKGLSNAGTWFIGRLQTQRDKDRVLDGLEGAAAGAGLGFDRGQMDGLLSQLGTRVFVMSNVHEDAPTVFETRWCLSYLRGPMTREQLKRLTAGGAAGPAPASPKDVAASPVRSGAARVSAASGASGASPGGGAATRPVLPPDVPQFFLAHPAAGSGEPVRYQPMVLGIARVWYADAKAGIDVERSLSLLTRCGSGPVAVDWDRAEVCDIREEQLQPAAEVAAPGGTFEAVPAQASRAKSFDEWRRSLADSILRSRPLVLRRCAAMRATSQPGETEQAFRVRLMQMAREARDAAAEKLRAKYAPKVATLQDRLRRAEQAVAVQKQQASQAKVQTAISFGSAVLSAFLGRKMVSAGSVGRAATAARGVGRSMAESADVGRAEESVDALRARLATVEQEMAHELAEFSAGIDAAGAELEEISVKPKKSAITVRAVVLVWRPAPGA